jgi:hypothetical protein
MELPSLKLIVRLFGKIMKMKIIITFLAMHATFYNISSSDMD